MLLVFWEWQEKIPIVILIKGNVRWLIVKELEKATLAQWTVFEEHYGIDDPESDIIIKSLYQEKNLLDKSALFKEKSYQIVCKMIKE